MNNKFERAWKKAVMTQFEALYRHLTEMTEANHEKPQSGYTVSGLRFELGTSRIQSKRANHST
jgi:hypothetical protein